MQLKRKCNVTLADYLGLSHIWVIQLVKMSVDIVGLKAASIAITETSYATVFMALFKIRYFMLVQ